MCVEISLDAQVRSDLDWSVQLKSADLAEKQGRKILWHLNLGLFESLRGLTQSTDFQGLALALDYFVEKVWSRYALFTQGIVLFTGSPNLLKAFPWDETLRSNYLIWLAGRIATPELEILYCWQSATEYIALLTRNLPDGLPLFVRLDLSQIEGLTRKVEILNPALLPRLQIASLHAEPFWSRYTWECLPKSGVKAALCLPIENLKQLPEQLLLIPEEELTASWDGLDRIYYDASKISPNGKRKLQGFVAAGGQILDLNHIQAW